MLYLTALAAATALGSPPTASSVAFRPPVEPREIAISDIVPDEKARRIFRTVSGGILRGVSRRTESGAWQVKAKRGWVDLPEASIEHVGLETALLDELESRLDADDAAPAEVLAWAFDVGLLKEAFELGDDLLDESPRDQDLRLACTRATRYVAGMPERGGEGELDALRRIGASGSPIVREAIVERLLTAAPRAEVLAAILEDMKSKASGRRAFALFAQGRLFPTEDARTLLLHAMWDPAPAARVAAARSIGDVGALEVASPLVRALSSQSSATRIRAAEALGHIGEDVFVEPLIDRMYIMAAPAAGGGRTSRPPHSYIFIGTQRAYVQDFDVEVAQGSSVADPVINTLLTGSVLDVGVIGIDRISVRTEQRALHGALQRLVGGRVKGQRRPSRPGDWVRWWESSDEAKALHR